MPRSLISSALLSFTICLFASSTVCPQDIKMQKLGGGRFMTESVREVPSADMKGLRVSGPENLGGNLTVTTVSVPTVRLEMRKIFKVATEAQASTFDTEIQFDVKTVGSTLDVTITTARNVSWENSDQSARVELVISVPENWDIEFNGRFFDLDLLGPFRRVGVSTAYGRVKLAKATERVRATGSHTAIELLGAKGDIAAQTSFADLVMRDAIPSAERPARLTNSFGSIVVEKLAGAVVAETDNAPIFLSDVVLLGSGTSLRSANAMVRAEIREFGNAELDIRNSNGAVILSVPKNLSARLNCSVGTGGSIQTGGLVLQTHPELLGLGHLEGVCGDGRGLIDVTVDGPGQIGIQGE